MAPATTASRKRTSTPPPKDKTKSANSKVNQENRKKAANQGKAVESREPEKVQCAQPAQAATAMSPQALVVVSPTKLAVIGHTAWALAQWFLAAAVIGLVYKCIVDPPKFSSLLERLEPLRTSVSTWAGNFSEYIATFAGEVGPVVLNWWQRICEGHLTDIVSEVSESPMKLGCVLASSVGIMAVVALFGFVVVRGIKRVCLKRRSKVE